MAELNEKYHIIYEAIQGKPVTVKDISAITGESKSGVTNYLNRMMNFEASKRVKVLSRSITSGYSKANKCFPYQYLALLPELPEGFLSDGRKPEGSNTNTPSAPLWGNAPESTVKGVKNKNKLGYEGPNGIVRLSDVRVKHELRKLPKNTVSGSTLSDAFI